MSQNSLKLSNKGHALKKDKRRKPKIEESRIWTETRKAKKRKTLLQSHNVSVKDSNTQIVEEITNGKKYTISIAVPGSILDNAQSSELRTYLAGQIARAASIFNVAEIVVFDEQGVTGQTNDEMDEKKTRGCRQFIRILEYLECPQYLRRYFFPLHKDLEYAGLLNPLDISHHFRADEDSKYREGVILNKPVKDGKGSYVYIGLQKTAVIDKSVAPNVRVTVKLNDEQTSKKHMIGRAVSPCTPCKKDGLYWGYTVRFAKSFGSIFSGSPYNKGYDCIIGTSDKGTSIDSFTLPSFKHMVVVFGGLKGLEYCLEVEEELGIEDPKYFFEYYLNTCPSQGSRIIRTEEAILITLSSLRPLIQKTQGS